MDRRLASDQTKKLSIIGMTKNQEGSQGGHKWYEDSLCKWGERHNHPVRKTSALRLFSTFW